MLVRRPPVRYGAREVVLRLGAIIGAVFLLAVGGGSLAHASLESQGSAGRVSAASATFTKLRACGTNRIPYKGTQCKRDQRRSGLVFKEIDCSVRVAVPKRMAFTASVAFNGQLQYILHRVLKPGRHNELIGVRVSPSQMPGGTYKCAFRLGNRRTEISFRTKGPTGNFLGASICVTPAGKNKICRADAAAKPIASPKSLMCGGVFVGFTGKSWGVKLTRQTSKGASVVGQYGAKRLPGPISEQWVAFKSRTKIGVYRPAKYSCLFFADGKVVASHDFTVVK
jgi:hypothetical protein